MDGPHRTAGVLLAAGEGSRYLGPTHKLRAAVAGQPLVSRALGNLIEAELDVVVVVAGAVDLADLVPPGVITVDNPDWKMGQATSLAAAVAWARAAGEGVSAIVVGLGDQPGIGPSAWRAVAGAAETPIAVATYDGRRSHPVRLAREVWDRLPMTGDTGAKSLMVSSPELVTEVPCSGDPADIDTAEDLTRWG